MHGQKKHRGSADTMSVAQKHVLERLKATSSDVKERPADFGSIRFKRSRGPHRPSTRALPEATRRR